MFMKLLCELGQRASSFLYRCLVHAKEIAQHVEEILCHNQRAPVDDVMAWGESLDHLLECKTGQLVFEDFLRTEYSEENLQFWLACEDYKKITSVTEMKAAAKRIYTEFVQVDAPRQINIDCVTREEISETLSHPGPNCFDRAQRLIYGLMENDCYPRFLKSEIYQALLEQAEQR